MTMVSDCVVSPPMSGQSNASANANKPFENSLNHAVSTRGKPMDRVKPKGCAPIAAKSDKFTASDLCPKVNGATSAKKCRPSINKSLETTH